jgi:light-regulated signal transduction histidine kinase (bacteriophytochrome)
LLINRLLEYTKFADAEPIKEIIDFKALIQEVFAELLLVCTHRDRVELHFQEELPVILGDHILMKQVITNIISNSLKFTRNKETAIMEVGYFIKNDEDIFYIKDNGVGFDMKFSENLFKLFQRMHSQNDFEGSGLGLAIVKKIIPKFGGRVWIEGEVGKGACTYFTIGHENILK